VNLARKKQLRRPASVAEKAKHSKQPSTKATSQYQPVTIDQMLTTHDSDSERRTQRSAMKQQFLKKLLVRQLSAASTSRLIAPQLTERLHHEKAPEPVLEDKEAPARRSYSDLNKFKRLN